MILKKAMLALRIIFDERAIIPIAYTITTLSSGS